VCAPVASQPPQHVTRWSRNDLAECNSVGQPVVVHRDGVIIKLTRGFACTPIAPSSTDAFRQFMRWSVPKSVAVTEDVQSTSRHCTSTRGAVVVEHHLQRGVKELKIPTIDTGFPRAIS